LLRDSINRMPQASAQMHMQAWRHDMKYFGKTLGLLLASLALASCGGGGGDGGAFTGPESGTITLSATTSSLPVNIWGYQPIEYGNPTQAEVTMTWRNADGTLVSGQDMHVSIGPTNVAALSCLVDGDECEDGNQLFGSVVIKGTNGQATIFVNSTDTAGTAVFTVSAQDPTTLRTVSASMNFTITSGVGPMPASVALTPNPTGVYLPSSGGSNTSSISATVRVGAGQLVPDPVAGNAGVDNIQFEIVGDAGDARLSSSSVGGSVTGTTVTSHTVHGVAIASFQAGEATPQGPVQVRATADRADNNVSNGIEDPVTFTTSIIVSDGKLYSLEFTSPLFAPNLPGITINTVSGEVDAGDVGTIPADPDATLSLTVSALATDRQGNPVIPGTAIRFGLIDEPVGEAGTLNDNQFLLSGSDGNPLEGGTAFTAPTGHFTTAGGGAGPGDALLVFGKAVQGNEDLESAVTVQQINSATSLSVLPVFNRNNTTGVSVDNGPVLPYVIGRAEHGNITAQATTNDIGVAHGTLNYTVNTVGNALAAWAQGDGVDRVSNAPRRVTDLAYLGYPGVAPASIVAFPNPLIGNSTQSVTVCVSDALGIRLRGVQVGFQFTLPAGTGSIDGGAGAGTFDSLTDTDGCVVGTVVTSGLPATGGTGNSGQVVFTGAGATSDPVDFIVEVSSLQANPNAVPLNCIGTQTPLIAIRALGVDGSPIGGVEISAVCTASGGDGASLTPNPTSGTTNSSGIASFAVTAEGFVGAGTPPSYGQGECVFTSSGASSRSVTVRFFGSAASPAPMCGP
jgi:hypothetical protein